MLTEGNYEQRKAADMWVKIEQGGIIQRINLDNVNYVTFDETGEAAKVYHANDEEPTEVSGAENIKELERCIGVASGKGSPFAGRSR